MSRKLRSGKLKIILLVKTKPRYPKSNFLNLFRSSSIFLKSNRRRSLNLRRNSLARNSNKSPGKIFPNNRNNSRSANVRVKRSSSSKSEKCLKLSSCLESSRPIFRFNRLNPHLIATKNMITVSISKKTT